MKTVIVNNAVDSQDATILSFTIERNFGFSLRSLLISIGLSENRSPSESQKTSLLVKCVNRACS